MPRKAPTNVDEVRITLGDYERNKLVEFEKTFKQAQLASKITNGVGVLAGAATAGALVYGLYRLWDITGQLPPPVDIGRKLYEMSWLGQTQQSAYDSNIQNYDNIEADLQANFDFYTDLCQQTGWTQNPDRNIPPSCKEAFKIKMQMDANAKKKTEYIDAYNTAVANVWEFVDPTRVGLPDSLKSEEGMTALKSRNPVKILEAILGADFW